MTRARRILFWTHLVVGLAAGGVIVVTVFTGACMAFEKQVLAWAERDLRRVTPPAVDTPRLALETLVAKTREAAPGAPLSELTIRADPSAAVLLVVGRTNRFFGNPYTGEVQAVGPSAWRDFFQRMLRWHRWLGVAAPPRLVGGEERERERGGRAETPGGAHAIARTVVGISAGLFALLCVSGLCLWWPRSWRWKTLRTGLTPSLRLRGKARDWSWHNAVGFWSAPVLLVMSVTGLVMAFRPVGNLIYGAPLVGGPGTNPPTFTTPEPGARPLRPEQLVVIAQQEVPGWEEITVRTGGRSRGGSRGGRGGGEAVREEGQRGVGEEDGPKRAEDAGRGGGGGGGRPTPASTVIVRPAGSWPTESIQLHLHPFTGDVLRRTTLATQISEQGWRAALRGLNRTLHTGEAGGWVGQFLAFGACLAGLLLVYTGFALSWRRLVRRRAPAPAPSLTASATPPPAAAEAIAALTASARE